MFERILIANRGEIAVRIIRACRELHNVKSVAIFSDADRDSAHVHMADEAICIGGQTPRESYLRADLIIAAAEATRCDAIHPGYGFLAENPQFAEKCLSSGFAFIGPSAEAMRLLGDKATAREVARKAKVQTVPGSDGLVEDGEAMEALADKIGYPLMIKASAGGGGRGMRMVHNRKELAPLVKQARLEAKAAFNNDAIYFEKVIEQPRHVEVQVLADAHGHVVHLFERDCSTQRRHQKLIEESPSPAINARTRRSLCDAAVRLARAARYTTACTVEFLVDAKGNYYFIEVNTRIQVEHPVTELITGVDLIKEQIRVAAGEPLSFTQKNIEPRGHAIECRINAEDPAHGFRPCAGTIERFRVPGGPGVRVDTHAYQGYTISPYYDSLIAKLLVHQPTRPEAIRCMTRALREFIIEPIETTIPFHLRVLEQPRFLEGQMDTKFIERSMM